MDILNAVLDPDRSRPDASQGRSLGTSSAGGRRLARSESRLAARGGSGLTQKLCRSASVVIGGMFKFLELRQGTLTGARYHPKSGFLTSGMVNQTQISAAPLPHTRPTRSPQFEEIDSTKSIPKSPTPVPVCSSNAAVKMSYCKPDRTSMEPVRMNPEAQSSLTPSQAKSAPNVRRARTQHCKVNLSSVFFLHHC